MTRFTPLHSLDEGGQGDVWVALDQETENVVAQKFLRIPIDASTETRAVALRRFEREVRAQSTLIAPTIMPIVAFDFDSTPPYYIMPLASGGSLDARLRTRTPMSGIEVGEVAGAVLDALDVAHARPIIHRDLKPANILKMDIPGRKGWVVADFGLCRDITSDSSGLTRTGVTLGTTRYMAPEQSEGPHRVGPTADVYSVGCILFHCLTGEPPGVRQLDYSKVPDEYRSMVAKATALYRGDRYMSAQALRSEFEQIIGGTPLQVPYKVDALENATAHIVGLVQAGISYRDLTLDALIALSESLTVALGYRVIAASGDGPANFYIEDVTRGVGPVVVRQRKFNATTADLMHLHNAIATKQCHFGLFITNGRLSPEARKFAAANDRIIVIDGPSIQLHLERPPSARVATLSDSSKTSEAI